MYKLRRFQLLILLILTLEAVPAFGFLPPRISAFQGQILGHRISKWSTSLSLLASNVEGSTQFLAGTIEQSQVAGSLFVETLDRYEWLDAVAYNPVSWSVLVMLTIVGLLVTWENAVEAVRENSPKTIQIVVEQVLGEMGGLGFIGLTLSVALNKVALGAPLGEISERFLGDEEILVESFEYLHEAFFQTAIIFFGVGALMVIKVLDTIQKVTDIADEQMQLVSLETDLLEPSETVDGALSSDKPSNDNTDEFSAMEYYETMLYVEDTEDTNSIERELFMTLEQRGAEISIIRERLKDELDLPPDFRIQSYLEDVFSQNKLNLVTISPTLWLPLIPIIAVCNSIDLSHDVVNADSPNAAASSGFFLSTPSVFFPVLGVNALLFAWGVYNYFKMASIKEMLVPNLVRVSPQEPPCLIPPAVEDPAKVKAFGVTPVLLRPIEARYAEPATNRVQQLFGTIGAAGPEFYLQSIKIHTWFTVVCLVGFAIQIIPRDVYAVLNPDDVVVGDQANLVPELIAFSLFAAINLLQLRFAPTTFLNYCLVSCVEELIEEQCRKARLGE